MLCATWFSRWVDQRIPALPACRKIVEINRHVGDIVREGAQIELSDCGESTD